MSVTTNYMLFRCNMKYKCNNIECSTYVTSSTWKDLRNKIIESFELMARNGHKVEIVELFINSTISHSQAYTLEEIVDNVWDDN